MVDRYNDDNDDEMTRNGERRLMQERLPRARVVFNVGANVGECTAQALRINPPAEYHLPEPSAATFAKLTARGFPSHVVPNNVEPGEQAGDIWEYVMDANHAYAFYKIHPATSLPVVACRQRLETFPYSNWLIARSGS